jgi:DNA modification methylase
MDQPRFQLTQGDAVTWLRTLPAGSVDLVITDPPYESLEKHRAIGTTTRLKHSKASSNDWFEIFPNSRFPDLFTEVYRVLKKDTHFYLFCDPETMFVAKPLAEAAGFKFWKPLIWDKCLGPETLVWTQRGVVRIDEIIEGDRVALPEGGSTRVKATRRTKAPSVRLGLSDGTELIASRDHRFLRTNGALVEASALTVGEALCTRPTRERVVSRISLDDVIPDDDAAYELRDVTKCLPRTLDLDYELGKLIGLYAAEGSKDACGVTFALHANETHLHSTIARFARSIGANANVHIDGNNARVAIGFKLMSYLIEYFVGGESAPTKYFKPIVYAAPEAFRHGALDGLLEGDGHWSHDEQRESYVSASPDLTMFVRRELESRNRAPQVRRFENDHAGGWTVCFDPIKGAEATTVVSIEDAGMQDLVDISVEDRDELFLLANGVVTHNCTIGMGYHYRARYECVLFFEKGKRKLHDLGIADILEHKRVNGGYPAEKPPEISEILIKQSSETGGLVIDPFMGSGSVGVAAVRNARDFRGNDLCLEAMEITRQRLLDAGALIGERAIHDEAAPQLGMNL